MDSGRFESVARVCPWSIQFDCTRSYTLFKPYPFHQVMRSMFVPLQMATDARHLQLVTDLDESIDKVRFPLGVHDFIYSCAR